MGLRGNLQELALADLIEMTSLGGKTGLLLLYGADDAPAGQLAFRDGRLVGAACGNLIAEKAFYTLLDLRDGSFDFDPDAHLDEETCNLATASLLMEGMRRIDEVQQLRRELPAPAVVRLHFRGATADDPAETRVLGYVGPGERTIGDIVDGMLVGRRLRRIRHAARDRAPQRPRRGRSPDAGRPRRRAGSGGRTAST